MGVTSIGLECDVQRKATATTTTTKKAQKPEWRKSKIKKYDNKNNIQQHQQQHIHKANKHK